MERRLNFNSGLRNFRMVRYGIKVVLVYFFTALLVFMIYRVAYQSILNEIRNHAIGVAISMAAAVDPEDLEGIQTGADMEKTEFQRIAGYLGRITQKRYDVRYAYLMRRDPAPEAKPSDLVYIVDSPPFDYDQDGKISVEEDQETTGTPYDASDLPEMMAAWEKPTADIEITPDPPYPDLLSGYAPIRDASGKTVALLGVDILASTVGKKLFYLRLTALGVLFAMFILESLAIILFIHRGKALRRIQALTDDLQKSNEVLESVNTRLRANNRQFRQELELARKIQQGFLPEVFPFEKKLQFGQLSLFCELLGGDLYDAFPVGEHHVGFYMADVSGHGVSAALISGLLKMSIETLRVRVTPGNDEVLQKLLHPKSLLDLLNRTLRDSLTEGEFITFCYAVYDTRNNQVALASAGHTPPIHYRAKQNTAEYIFSAGSFPFGSFPEDEYQEEVRQLAPGDKMILYTDGITEAHTEKIDFYGEEKLLSLVQEKGEQEPEELIRTIKESLDAHLKGNAVHDDFTMLVVQVLP